jgi:hypothetical protein
MSKELCTACDMAAATAVLTRAPDRRVSVPAALMILLAIRSVGRSFDQSLPASRRGGVGYPVGQASRSLTCVGVTNSRLIDLEELSRVGLLYPQLRTFPSASLDVS